MRRIVIVGVLLMSSIGRGQSPVFNKDPLKSAAMADLPLGSIKPAGWLKTQLQLAADGLTGHAEQVIPELGPDSGWLGGTGKHAESWEKGPYYVKGLVSLAYTLDDAALKQKAQKWIDWSINSQKPDGSFGPAQNNEWWPRMVMTYALRDYAEATGDPRVVPMLTKYCHYMLANLPKRPLHEWAKARAGDQIDTVFWLYNRTGDAELLKLADLLHQQAYDWTDIFTNDKFLAFGDDIHPKHNVNVCQAFKFPAVWSQRSGDVADKTAYFDGVSNGLRQTTFYAPVTTGTEYLAGNSIAQGVEMCSIVEKMLSDETAVRILGDGHIADAIESVAYNALPAGMSKDLKRYSYYTTANQVTAIKKGHGYNQDYDDGLLCGPVSGFPCCCYNLHMGWPKLVQHAWMATPDGGLAAVIYGPSVATTTIGGNKVTVEQATNYPFEDTVTFHVKSDRPITFPLHVRCPTHSDRLPQITVNGEQIRWLQQPRAGAFVPVHVGTKDGEGTVVVQLSPIVRIRQGINGAVALARGPLVYTLPLSYDKHAIKPDENGFYKAELTPTRPWNFALTDPRTVEFQAGAFSDHPFQSPNLKLVTKAKRVDGWTLDWAGSMPFDPPVSPAKADGPEETISLVPVGSTDLRVTFFPVAGEPTPTTGAFLTLWENSSTPGWVTLGGGWMVQDGRLHTVSNAGGFGHGARGVKAVAMATDYEDFFYRTDVQVGPKGNAGVIFRVSDPAIGADAYSGYYAGVSAADGCLVVGRSGKSGYTELARKPLAVKPWTTVALDVTAVGSKIDVSVDGTPTISVNDDTYRHGSIGVREYADDIKQTLASFGKVSVTPK